MKYILDFCGVCGQLLITPMSAECDNCGKFVVERKDRAQGEFEEEDAKRLFDAFDADLPNPSSNGE